MTDPRICDGPAVADVQAGQCLSRAELSGSELGKAGHTQTSGISVNTQLSTRPQDYEL